MELPAPCAGDVSRQSSKVVMCAGMGPAGDAIALRSQAARANCTNRTGCSHLTVYPREPSDFVTPSI